MSNLNPLKKTKNLKVIFNVKTKLKKLKIFKRMLTWKLNSLETTSKK